MVFVGQILHMNSSVLGSNKALNTQLFMWCLIAPIQPVSMVNKVSMLFAQILLSLAMSRYLQNGKNTAGNKICCLETTYQTVL
jgi:hypothetical protein